MSMPTLTSGTPQVPHVGSSLAQDLRPGSTNSSANRSQAARLRTTWSSVMDARYWPGIWTKEVEHDRAPVDRTDEGRGLRHVPRVLGGERRGSTAGYSRQTRSECAAAPAP